MSNHNTHNHTITQQMIDATQSIQIISGEGEVGSIADYRGARTVRAVRAALTRERCHGDRWAILLLNGERI